MKNSHRLMRTLSFVALLMACGAHGSVAADSHAAIDAALASARMPADRNEDAWRNPRAVLEFLELAPGQRALDFYAGPGYFSELIARVIGADGQVVIYNNELYAQAAHNQLMQRLARNRLPNTTMQREASNYLRLAPASLDRVLFSLVYHDLYWQPRGSPDTMGDPKKVLRILRDALKPGGLVVVVDHAANPTPRESITQVASRLHRIDPAIVRADFEEAGFVFVGASDALRSDQDNYARSVFDLSVRRNTDRFMYKFRRP